VMSRYAHHFFDQQSVVKCRCGTSLRLIGSARCFGTGRGQIRTGLSPRCVKPIEKQSISPFLATYEQTCLGGTHLDAI